MKNKLGLSALALILSAGLAACGGETEETPTADEPTEETTEQPATEEPAEPAEETTEDSEFETEVGETIENEGATSTLLARNDQLEPVTTGPITISFPQVNAVTGTAKGELADYLETESLEYIQVDMEVSNASDENVTFYASQSTITTNTGEQLEPEMILSDHIDGEYIGKVNKQGSVYYLLQNSKAEDVEWVRILIDAPQDAAFNSIGDPVDVQADFK